MKKLKIIAVYNPTKNQIVAIINENFKILFEGNPELEFKEFVQFAGLDFSVDNISARGIYVETTEFGNGKHYIMPTEYSKNHSLQEFEKALKEKRY